MKSYAFEPELNSKIKSYYEKKDREARWEEIKNRKDVILSRPKDLILIRFSVELILKTSVARNLKFAERSSLQGHCRKQKSPWFLRGFSKTSVMKQKFVFVKLNLVSVWPSRLFGFQTCISCPVFGCTGCAHCQWTVGNTKTICSWNCET